MLSRKWFLLAIFAVLIIPFASLSAQDQPTVSIALPAFMRNVFDESAFSDFESANNANVYVNYVDANVPDPTQGIDTYLDAVAKYAAAADVLYLNGGEVTPYSTRAGYFLDLSPLTSADSTLNPDDFIPAAWASVQWDGGVWALPVGVDATMLVYNPEAFDRAGLAYPNANWTLDDLINAAKALTQYDSSGKVTTAGLNVLRGTGALFRSLYGQNFYDANGTPKFADPALEDLLTKWQDFAATGEIGSSFSIGTGGTSAPLSIISSFGLQVPPNSNATPPAAVVLPGGSIGLSMTGVGVSSGTTQPELAYKLAEYITSSPAFADGPFSAIPARQSLTGTQAPTPAPSTSGGVTFAIGGGSSPAVQAALDNLLPHALTFLDQAFADYVNSALNTMTSDNVDAQTALQQAEAQAASDLQTAANRKSSVSVVVATPPPPVVLAPGKIALKFGLQSFVQPIPNLDQWQQLANDFSASDPDVGEVNLDTTFGDATQFAQNDDCFYLASNAVPNLDETTIRSLDPYLDADPNFDPNDVVGGLMSQLQKDSHTWAYPLTIQAQTLNLNAQIFQQAGVPLPDNGWTIDQFVDALKTLKDYLGNTPFAPRDPNGESLMMLIAAYGGLPIDYRTNPATINFSDPATVAAIQQVLDLAKNGYIDYQALTGLGNGFRVIALGGPDKTPITSDALGGFRRIVGGGSDTSDIRLVSYPSGKFTGASYSIGTGYISATAQNPDACYRWLSYIAQHAGIFGSMPARLSQINDPTFQANAGANAAFYQQYAQVLASPTTIVFPTAAGGNNEVGDFIIQYWLNRAFDNYVLNNADLTSELTTAQTDATAFQQCVAALPPADTTTTGGGGVLGINQGIADCATKVDSSLANLFAASAGASSGGG